MRREYYNILANKQKFPKVGNSGTSYDKASYEQLTVLEKIAEGFIFDPDVVYGAAEDDIRFVGDYTVANGTKVPIAISKFNMIHNLSGFTFKVKSKVEAGKVLKIAIVPSTIEEGGTATVTATLSGSTVTATITSSDETVATVSGSTITAVAAGNATITATYTVEEETGEVDEDDNPITETKTYTATATVKVTAAQIIVVNPTVTAANVSVVSGSEATIVATVTKGTYDIASVKFGSNIMTLDGTEYKYTFTPTATQNYTIKVTDTEGNEATTTVEVTVNARPTTAKPSISNVKGSVTITGDGTIYYTTNGDTPTTSSTVYSGPFTVINGATVKAIAKDGEKDASAVETKAISWTVVSPTVSISVSPESAYDSAEVTVTATVTKGDGEITTVKCNGVEMSGTGPYTFTETITASKAYKVVVTDDLGKIGEATKNVTINASSYALSSSLATIDLAGDASKTGTISNTLKKNNSTITEGVTYEYTPSAGITVSNGVVTVSNSQGLAGETNVGTVTVKAKVGETVVDTKTVTVKAKDTHSFTVLASVNPIEVGGNTTLSTTGATGEVTYALPEGTTYATISGTTLTGAAETSGVEVTAIETLNGKTYTATVTIKINAKAVEPPKYYYGVMPYLVGTTEAESEYADLNYNSLDPYTMEAVETYLDGPVTATTVTTMSKANGTKYDIAPGKYGAEIEDPDLQGKIWFVVSTDYVNKAKIFDDDDANITTDSFTITNTIGNYTVIESKSASGGDGTVPFYFGIEK